MNSRARFDPDAYTGLWYELGRYPFFWENSPQSYCSYATAEYDVVDEELEIVNSCYDSRGKKTSQRRGYAKAMPNAQQTFNGVIFTPVASFDVVFCLRPTDPPSQGGEYIIGDTDYSYYSIVLSPQANLAWIIVREPFVSEETAERLLDKAADLGVDDNIFRLNNIIRDY